MAAIYETKKKRSRTGMYLAGGVGVFLAAYLPSFTLFPARIAPVLSTAAAAFILILIAMRFRSLREGLVAGLILGLVAGAGSWGANRYCVDRALATLTALLNLPTQGDPETQPADEVHATSDTQPAPTSLPAEELVLTPEDREECEEGIRLFTAYRDKLPALCILPNVLLGAVIGLIFARAAVKRRQQTQSPWQ